MEERKCTTHHHACDCREEKIKRLVRSVRSALDDLCVTYDIDGNSMRECDAADQLRLILKEWEGEFEK